MLLTDRRFLAVGALAALMTVSTAIAALGQQGEQVIIADKLGPARLEVPSGTLVTWRNEDGERHRVRSRQGPVEFDSGNLEPGEQFSVTFVVEGEYPYLDERNDDDPAYFGTIVVVGEPTEDGPARTAATVTIIDESFQPLAVEVMLGATVTWENVDGDDDHTVTSTTGAFNSGVLPGGSTFEHTFEAPGTYPYVCAIHPEMEGTISVVGTPQPTEDSVAESPAPADSSAPAQSPGPDGSPAADSETSPDEVVASAPAAVSIVDFSFAPSILEVENGSTVTWTNDDGAPHTVTASDGGFDSGMLKPGETFNQTFDTPGSFDYSCAFHPSMTGTVTVSP